MRFALGFSQPFFHVELRYPALLKAGTHPNGGYLSRFHKSTYFSYGEIYITFRGYGGYHTPLCQAAYCLTSIEV